MVRLHIWKVTRLLFDTVNSGDSLSNFDSSLYRFAILLFMTSKDAL